MWKLTILKSLLSWVHFFGSYKTKLIVDLSNATDFLLSELIVNTLSNAHSNTNRTKPVRTVYAEQQRNKSDACDSFLGVGLTEHDQDYLITGHPVRIKVSTEKYRKNDFKIYKADLVLKWTNYLYAINQVELIK